MATLAQRQAFFATNRPRTGEHFSTLMGVVATPLGSRRACVHDGVACLPVWPVCTSVGSCCSRRVACLPRPMIESERWIGCTSSPVVDPLILRSKNTSVEIETAKMEGTRSQCTRRSFVLQLRASIRFSHFHLRGSPFHI